MQSALWRLVARRDRQQRSQAKSRETLVFQVVGELIFLLIKIFDQLDR